MKSFLRKILSPGILQSLKLCMNRMFGHNKLQIMPGNKFDMGNSIIEDCNILIKGTGNQVVIGRNNVFRHCTIKIFGSNSRIFIGTENFFNESIFWLEDESSEIIIGNNNKFCGKTHMGIVEGTALTIGNDCLFSSDIYITSTDSHSIISKDTGKRINPSLSVTLGNHVWIGHRVSILKGVEIGNDCIVGCGSILTRAFLQDNVILAGTPAKIIKKNISWDINRI